MVAAGYGLVWGGVGLLTAQRPHPLYLPGPQTLQTRPPRQKGKRRKTATPFTDTVIYGSWMEL